MACCGCGLDHRVFARDVVGRDRAVETLAHRPDHVEVGERRLDHQHVCTLVEVERAFAKRLADVRWIHLVAAPVSEGRGRFGHLAERAVERGGVLGGIGDDRRLRQRFADRTDAAVHHVARRDDIRARLDVARSGSREQLERVVVLDLAVPQDAAMPVARVLTQADVGDERQVRHLGPKGSQGALDDPVGVPRARSFLVLFLGDPEQEHGANPEGLQLARLADDLVDRALRNAVKPRDRAHDPFAGNGEEWHHDIIE